VLKIGNIVESSIIKNEIILKLKIVGINKIIERI